MSPDPPAEVSPGTMPSTDWRRRLGIGVIIMVILAVLLGVCYVVNHKRNMDWVVRDQDLFRSWTDQIRKENSLPPGSLSSLSQTDWWTSHGSHQKLLTTPTGRSISIMAKTQVGPGGSSGQVVLSSEGRSITWPIEDVERGRKVDLKTEFPEAFR